MAILKPSAGGGFIDCPKFVVIMQWPAPNVLISSFIFSGVVVPVEGMHARNGYSR